MTFEQMLAQAKQLYNGTQELQRVYNGETMVWNRYNWEKWSCNSETVTETIYYKNTAGTSTIDKDTVLTEGYLSYSFDKYTGTFAGFNPRSNVTLAQLAAETYWYAYDIAGTAMLEFDLRSLADNKFTYTAYRRSEPYVSTYTEYSKGTTQYADVNGLKGDYPANGRASDGYWYVAKGAVYFGGS